jgi:hypothetical protein
MLSYKTVLLALLFSSSSLALPIRREVPQEHSHQQFLTTVQTNLQLNNPDKIVDAVFGLLGDAAAAAGQGSITDTDCLQQATADQAFTNAKAAGDVEGQTAALIYRALERNTGTVGGVSAACTSITAVNPEIAAIQQHQDPASPNAAAVNKAIVLELAKQIASIGGDPQDALKSGTFAPGNLGDTTGKGNTCDVATDATGCIFTQNLLVEDATADEITAAVAGVSSSSGSSAAASSSAASSTSSTDVAEESCPAAVTVTVTADAGATAAATTSSSTAATTTAPPSAVEVASTSSSIGNFGSCSVPQIEFATGFDGRTETSFQPVDKVSYNHGSADNIAIITQFMCDTLTNTCGADATAKATCAAAQAAAAAQTQGQGIDADAFNGVFGIATNFRNVEAVSDQGVVNADSTGGSVSVASVGATETGAAAPGAETAVAITATSSSVGNFGTCTIPQIEFGVGFDGRTETAFQPVDKVSYNHGSADNIAIITQFMCDQLVNSCGADATAKATCAAAQAAAAAQTQGQGIDADAFNGVFGIATNFRNVEAVSDQGVVNADSTGGTVSVAVTGAAETGAAATAAATTAAAATAAATTAAATTAAAATTVAAATATAAAATATGVNVQAFTGALGGITAPPVLTGGSKGFVTDNSDFINAAAAITRSCSVQHNECANAANAAGQSSTFTVSDCDTQNTQCSATPALSS